MERRKLSIFVRLQERSQSAWEGFLNHLHERGLKGESFKLIVLDGGKGLLATLFLVHGEVPMQQRCWTHKTRNVLNYVKRADQQRVKRSLQHISHAPNLRGLKERFSDLSPVGKPAIPKPPIVFRRIYQSCSVSFKSKPT